MRRIRSIVIATAVAAPLLAIGTTGVAQAYSSSCIDGQSLGGTFYNDGSAPAINESTAWRFEAKRPTAGEFYVGFFSNDGGTGLITQFSTSAANTYTGLWSKGNSPSLANSEKVTNYGTPATFTYDRSCTTV